MKTLFILVVLLCMSFALALKCNICQSTTSMGECRDREYLEDCGMGFNRCVKWSYEYKIGSLQYKNFHKGCYSETLCSIQSSALKSCRDSGGECQLDCCDTDGCNGGSAPVYSIFLISTCAVVALFR